jgi:hypothetical protein
VTHYLDQWRLRYCPDVPNLNSRLEKDPKTAQLVHRIQDRLSSLRISPNDNLQDLIQQAVILQEVVTSDVEKREPLPRINDEDDSLKSSKRPFPATDGLEPSNDPTLIPLRIASPPSRPRQGPMELAEVDHTKISERTEGKSQPNAEYVKHDSTFDDGNGDKGIVHAAQRLQSPTPRAELLQERKTAVVISPHSCKEVAGQHLTAVEGIKGWGSFLSFQRSQQMLTT